MIYRKFQVSDIDRNFNLLPEGTWSVIFGWKELYLTKQMGGQYPALVPDVCYCKRNMASASGLTLPPIGQPHWAINTWVKTIDPHTWWRFYCRNDTNRKSLGTAPTDEIKIRSFIEVPFGKEELNELLIDLI